MAVSVVLVLLALVNVQLVRSFATPHALGPNSIGSGASLDVAPGDRTWFGFAGFLPHGDLPIHLTGFRLTGVPPGLAVLRTQASHFGQHGYPAVETDGGMATDFSDLHPTSVSAATIVPGQQETWFLLTEVTSEHPGRYRTTGIEIEYEVGWRRGTAYFPYTIEIDVGASKPG